VDAQVRKSKSRRRFSSQFHHKTSRNNGSNAPRPASKGKTFGPLLPGPPGAHANPKVQKEVSRDAPAERSASPPTPPASQSGVRTKQLSAIRNQQLTISYEQLTQQLSRQIVARRISRNSKRERSLSFVSPKTQYATECRPCDKRLVATAPRRRRQFCPICPETANNGDWPPWPSRVILADTASE
jgi:hypothetical protein